MKRWFAVALLSIGLTLLVGPWKTASASDDHNNGDKKSDFALFHGTNPAPEAPPGARSRTGTLSSSRSRRTDRSAFRNRSAGRRAWKTGSGFPTVAIRPA